MNVFGFTFIFHLQQVAAAVGGMCLFYGLYFGVLGRDVAELCSDWMANTVGIKVSAAQEKYYDPCRCAICNLDFEEDIEMIKDANFVPEAHYSSPNLI